MILAIWVACLLASPLAWGKNVIEIHSLVGNAFAINGSKTWTLAKGEFVEDFVEILTEEGGQIAFSDFTGSTYHLAGSGHIKLINKVIELKRGYLWVQNSGKGEAFIIHTANSVVQGLDADAIISFDHVSGKSQVLTTRNRVDFHHILRSHLKENIFSGHFSFVEDDFEDGRPRVPTPVGFATFQNVMRLFGHKQPAVMTTGQENQKVRSREVASILPNSKEELPPKVKNVRGGGPRNPTTPGQIIFLRKDFSESTSISESQPSPLVINVEQHLKEDLKNIQKTQKKTPSPVQIKILGVGRGHVMKSQATGENKKTERTPASLQEAPLQRGEEAPRGGQRESRSLLDGSYKEFESSLNQEKFKQKRHADEVNQLIHDLESFSQDFEEHY